jgi:hypothetical protein
MAQITQLIWIYIFAYVIKVVYMEKSVNGNGAEFLQILRVKQHWFPRTLSAFS